MKHASPEAFREHAAKEVGALLKRAAEARADRSTQDLQAIRTAFAAAVQTLERVLTDRPQAESASEVAALVERLSTAAGAEADKKLQALRAEHKVELDGARTQHKVELDGLRTQHKGELDGVRTQAAAVEAQRERAAADLEAARTQVEQQKSRLAELETARKQAEQQQKARTAELEDLRGQFEQQKARADKQNGQLEEQKSKIAELTKTAKASSQQAESVAAELESTRAKLEASRTELSTAAEAQAKSKELLRQAEAARKEADAARKDAEAARKEEARTKEAVERELADVRTRVERTDTEASRLRTQFETTVEDLHRQHAETLREQKVASTALPLNGLLEVFHGLDVAASVGDVLTTLVGGLARELSRVALFRVQGNRLEGMQQAGFEFDRDISKLAFPLSVDSMLTRAAASGRLDVCLAPDTNEPGRVPFGGTPSCALALPIAIHGETLAVIYADDSDRMEETSAAPQLPAKFAELLFHHAQLVLLRIATEQKTLAELREYASMLVNEIEYGYNSDLDAGRPAGECQSRLKDSLECTRRIYAQRVAGEKPATLGLLDERLRSVVEARNNTPFGRDLAMLLKSMPENVAAAG